jgi:dGTPase
VQHDIDDSIRAGILKETDLPRRYTDVLGHSHGERITTLVTNLVNNTRYMMNEVLSQTENPCGAGNLQIGFTAEVDEALKGLRTFMFDNIYKGDVCAMERERAALVVHYLFDHYLSHAEQMPELYQKIAEEEGIRQGVCDYISGMSDAYCIALFKEITIPRSFIQTL